MRHFKIVDKNNSLGVCDFSFTSPCGIVHKKPMFVRLSEKFVLEFSSYEDAEKLADRLGENYKVVEL